MHKRFTLIGTGPIGTGLARRGPAPAGGYSAIGRQRAGVVARC